MRHALEHFLELTLASDDKDHHRKWVVISVHHCAQIFSCMLLKEFDCNNPIFKKKDWYPPLKEAVSKLLDPNYPSKITQAEKKLFELFKKLDKPRHAIYHREGIKDPDISLMAMALVGISRVAELRCGESAEDLIEASPTILKYVIEAIRWSRLKKYDELAEAFVRERYPNEHIQDCPWCGACAVVDTRCEACFEEVEEKICPNCNEEIIVLSSHPEDQFCGICKKQILL